MKELKNQVATLEDQQTLEDQLRTAEELLAALKAEQKRIPEMISESVFDNPDEVLRLKNRLSELPDQIFAAQTSIHRANIQICQARKSAALQAHNAAREQMGAQTVDLLNKIEKAKDELLRLQLQLNELRAVESNTAHDVQFHTLQLMDAEDALRRFIESETGADLSNPKPLLVSGGSSREEILWPTPQYGPM